MKSTCSLSVGYIAIAALRSATLWSVEAIEVSKDLGPIGPGKLADLVIVEGDPLTRIQDAWNVEMVLKNGELHRIEDLLKSLLQINLRSLFIN